MAKRVRIAGVLIILASFLLATSCTLIYKPSASCIESAREEISKQNYETARGHLRLLLREDPNNEEVKVLQNYISFKDDMLLAAFWEEDYQAVQYIAPIINNINREDSRFETSVLVLAAAWGKNDVVKTLLEAGADPNGSDKEGLTALMWACKNFDEQLEMVRALLEAGAEVNTKSNYAETPLSIANEYGNHNIVTLLKEYGAVE